MSDAMTAGPRRGAGPLWLMVAVFAAPVVAAWFLYFNPQYLPAGRTNLGELIEPVVPLPAGPGLVTPAGTELDREPLSGHWTLVYLADGPCDEDCLVRVTDLRQIRLALGEGGMSVERLVVLPETVPSGEAAALAERFPGLQIALAEPAYAERLIAALGEGGASLGRVHILDPMGNLMMRYAPDAPAKDILKDMGRLLKASKNWIKGAAYGHR